MTPILLVNASIIQKQLYFLLCKLLVINSLIEFYNHFVLSMSLIYCIYKVAWLEMLEKGMQKANLLAKIIFIILPIIINILTPSWTLLSTLQGNGSAPPHNSW